MTISLPDARQLSDEVLEALRLRAVRGCQLGYTETELAELLGLSRETVSRWWTAYADGGPDALPGGRTGRPIGSEQDPLGRAVPPHPGSDRRPQPRGVGHPRRGVEPQACAT